MKSYPDSIRVPMRIGAAFYYGPSGKEEGGKVKRYEKDFKKKVFGTEFFRYLHHNFSEINVRLL